MTDLFGGHGGPSEHRTVGSHRAWCYDCQEWCYPVIPCDCCLHHLEHDLPPEYHI